MGSKHSKKKAVEDVVDTTLAAMMPLDKYEIDEEKMSRMDFNDKLKYVRLKKEHYYGKIFKQYLAANRELIENHIIANGSCIIWRSSPTCRMIVDYEWQSFSLPVVPLKDVPNVDKRDISIAESCIQRELAEFVSGISIRVVVANDLSSIAKISNYRVKFPSLSRLDKPTSLIYLRSN